VIDESVSSQLAYILYPLLSTLKSMQLELNPPSYGVTDSTLWPVEVRGCLVMNVVGLYYGSSKGTRAKRKNTFTQ